MTTKLPTTGPTAALRTTESIQGNTRELGRLVNEWDVQAIRETIELLHVQLGMLSDALPRFDAGSRAPRPPSSESTGATTRARRTPR